MNHRLRDALPPGVMTAIRRASRLRWGADAGMLRRSGFPVREHPLEALRRVLLGSGHGRRRDR